MASAIPRGALCRRPDCGRRGGSRCDLGPRQPGLWDSAPALHAQGEQNDCRAHRGRGAAPNLGAGTVTSNLKNTYGPVSLWTPEGMRDTGMQFLGSLIGDHAKTGINLPLTTGTVVGAGANVFGTTPPKVVAPFSWGEGSRVTTYQVDKFLTVAERVMARRDVTLSDRARRLLAAAHAAGWTPG